MISRTKWLEVVVITLMMYIDECVLASATCDSSTVPHCTITSGNAVCNTTHIPPIIKSLPPCITTLHITQDNAYNGSFEKSNFLHLCNLREFAIDAKHKENLMLVS